MGRYVIDAPTLLHLVDTELHIDPDHQLVAPNSIRSEALELLLHDVRAGTRTEAAVLKTHERLTEIKMRLLGDRVSRRTAWQIARDIGLGRQAARWRLPRARPSTGTLRQGTRPAEHTRATRRAEPGTGTP